MSYTVPTFDQIRNQYLQAVVNQNPSAAIGPDSDHFVRASAIAAVVEGIYSHQAWVLRQAFPDLADSDYMERMANQRGVFRKAAVAAAGTGRFSGPVGAAIPLGQQFTNAQGIAFATTAAGVIGAGGTGDVAAAAIVAGAAGNQTDNTPATVNSPGALAGTATILTMTSGADVEDDSDLLSRLLLELAELAQGGNSMDYQRWARSVPGVKRCFVFPTRRGAGTVDVVPMPVSGLPSAPLIASVQSVLDANRPVGMLPGYGVMALIPTPLVNAVTATVVVASGYTLADITTDIEAAVAAVFSRIVPGGTLTRNQVITAIMNVPGVTDVTLALPAANVTSSVSSTALELITQGVLTLS